MKNLKKAVGVFWIAFPRLSRHLARSLEGPPAWKGPLQFIYWSDYGIDGGQLLVAITLESCGDEGCLGLGQCRDIVFIGGFVGGWVNRVGTKGATSWNFRCCSADKQPRIPLGIYPEIGLRDARAWRDVARGSKRR